MPRKKTYHLIGIGGIGMGTLASLMLAKGYRVTGSDLNESTIIHKLRQQGAHISIGHSVYNIDKADVVVHSSAIRMGNPEMIEAVSRNLPVMKRAQMLAELMQDYTGITVAGAHGKTTTSSMISCLLDDVGLNPTVAVGGVINQGIRHAQLGTGKYMVAEVDESDGSFLCFHPHYSVITNIDFEHVDYYKTWENIVDCYQKFIKSTVDEGALVICGDDMILCNLVKSSGKHFLSYGFDEKNDLKAINVTMEDFSSRFDVVFKGHSIGSVRLNVPGRHNVLNALAAIGIGYLLRIEFQDISRSLERFAGVKRRFQQKANCDGVLVVDDYAHHPTEIASTLQAAQSMGRNRVITIFQPHRYSRTKHLMEEFCSTLSKSDYLILTDIYAASERVSDGSSTKDLLERLQQQMINPLVYLPKDSIVQRVLDIVQPGDLVLTLGAGDVYQISDDITRALHDRNKGMSLSVEERAL